MLFLIFSVFILIKNDMVSDLMEGTAWVSNDWEKTDSSPLNNKQNCNDETAVGPFLLIDYNVQKQFNSLPPHYKLQLSLDVVQTQYWSGVMNYISVAIDSLIYYTASSINTITFTTPNTYCNNNQYFTFQFDQQLLTITQALPHTVSNPIITISSSFQCSFYLTFLLCEELMLKNLVLRTFNCHLTCLTCTGPNDNNCSTCPYGTPTNGQCSCQVGDSSYQNTCVSACPLYYVSNGAQQCILECSLQCLQCQYNKCIQCGVGYYNHLGKCLDNCPENSIQQGLSCQDFSESSPFGSLYIGIHFTNLDVDIINEVSKFTFSQTLGYSQQTSQLQSVYNNQYLLGGYGVWSEGKFSIIYNSLPAHNNIRIYLNAFIIDSWNNKQFIIKLDNTIILQNTYVSTSFSTNLFYGNAKDFIDKISLSIPHLATSATLTFETTLTVSSFSASIGLQYIYVLIDYCDNNCQVCSAAQCTQCTNPYQLIHNLCGLCDGSTNRDNSCTCLTGYYDDGISESCQQCRFECQSCNIYNDCSACKIGSNLIILPNCKNCNNGYYYDSGNCILCDATCVTCFGNGNIGCITCESNQILTVLNECQSCKGNQYLLNQACVDCSNNCSTCENQDSCTTCIQDRINAPLCECQIGYFENSDKICQICSELCTSCIYRYDNCLACIANREINLGCECPENSLQNTDSLWCTDCSTVVLDINYSNDLTKLIIDFRQPFREIYSDCSFIFEDDTLSKFGSNPICIVTSQLINVILSNTSTTTYGDIINLKSQLFRLKSCTQYITSFIDNFIQYPENTPSPLIMLSAKQVTLSVCQKKYVSILSYTNNGNRDLQFLKWVIIKSTQQGKSIGIFLDAINSNLNQTSIIDFYFPNNILDSNTSLVLELRFQNFLQILGSVLITITQSSDPAILQIGQQLSPYFITQPIILTISISLCEQYQIQNIGEIFNASITYKGIIDSIVLSLNQSKTYTIQQNSTFLLGSFDFIVSVSSTEDKYITKNQIVIMVINEEPKLLLYTGSTYVSYKQQIDISSSISTMKDTNISVKWECFDISLATNCLSSNQTQLRFQDSPKFQISPLTFDPYKVILVTASYINLKEQIQLFLSETDVPKISVQVYPDISSGYINYYDQLDFNFTYLDISVNPDSLLYSCIISNSNHVTKQFTFDYLEMQFQLWNYFTIEEITTQMIARFNIYNPEYFMPSSISIRLQINIPPKYCLITMSPSSGDAVQTDFQVEVNNCLDDNTPLQYKLLLYQNISDFKYDNIKGQIQKGVMLFDYQYENSFVTKLAGNGSVIIMIQAKDNLNGINNFTTIVNVIQIQQNLTSVIANSNILREQIIFAINLQYQSALEVQQYSNLIQIRLDNYQSCFCRQLQILKTLMARYQQFSISQINAQLQSTSNRLIEINSSLALLHSADFDKYEHTVQEFQRVQLFEETVNLATYISQLYSMKQNTYISSLRLLYQDNQTENNQLVISSIATISDIQLQNQKVNSEMVMTQTYSFNISTQKTTAKFLEKILGNSLTEQLSVQTPISDNIQKELDNQTYQYQMAKYRTNPYIFDLELQSINTNKSNYPLYSSQVIYIHNQSVLQTLNFPVRYSFEKNISSIVECATQIEKVWKVDACSIVDKGDTTVCECQQISPVTIIGAFKELVQEAADFFTLQTMKDILNYQYQTVIFTYIIIFDTILFLWFLYYGQKLDQLYREEQQFFSAKVAPVDWEILMKPKENIEQIGVIDSDYKFMSTRKLHERKPTQRKTIFSIGSQGTIEEKQQKKSESEQYSRALSSKRNLAITQHIYSIKKIDETLVENTPKSNKSSPNEQHESHHEGEQTTPEKSDALLSSLVTKKISVPKGYWLFFTINHKILSLYYLYDKDFSRIYRTIVLFISILGQISILTFFGKIINLNTIIALSIIQTVFGQVFRKLLSLFLHTEKMFLNYLGFNLASLSVLFFIFIILGSVAKYQSLIEATMWGAAYLTSFALEQFICIFAIIVKYGERESVQVFFTQYQSYLKYLLNDKVYQKVFGG